MIPDKNSMIQAAVVAANRLLASAGWPFRDSGDICLEGMLRLYQASGREEYLEPVKALWDKNRKFYMDVNRWLDSFTCLPFEMNSIITDDSFLPVMEQLAEYAIKTTPRDGDGAAGMLSKQSVKISVERMHGYVLLMARTGGLSRKNKFLDEAVGQCSIYRQILLDKNKGLWYRGRGWDGDSSMLNGPFWLRTQAIALHALAHTAVILPETYPGITDMKQWITNFTESLFTYRDSRGMWHQIADKYSSYPETAGTGIILESLYLLVQAGWLNKEKYLPMLDQSLTALVGFLHRDGRIGNAGMDFRIGVPAEAYEFTPPLLNNAFASGAFLLACASPLLPDNHINP